MKRALLKVYLFNLLNHSPTNKILEGKMNQEQPSIGYDEFMPQPLEERLRIFNEVSAENRASLIKTHVERWLTANRPRLSDKQIVVIEEMIPYITPELYRAGRNQEKVERLAEMLYKKAEVVFSREDMMQIMSNRGDYVPLIEDKKS
jgi:hypothetical protein